MLGGIIWRYITVSGSDFWYSYAWNPVIVVILYSKPFWTFLSSNWYIILSGNCINSYFHSHVWHLKLGGNAVIIGLGSVELCYICLCGISIHVWSIAISVHVPNFSLWRYSYFFLCLGQSWIIFRTSGLFMILFPSSLKNNLVMSDMETPLHELVLLNFSVLTCDKFCLLRLLFFCWIVCFSGKMKLICVAGYFVAAR